MIKIKIKDYQISKNGFIILRQNTLIRILTNYLTTVGQFYGHPMQHVIVSNETFNTTY